MMRYDAMPARATSRIGAAAAWLSRIAAAVAVPALTVALLVTLPAGRSQALTPDEVEARVQGITDMLRCPTCQGISVRDSEASFSRQIRDKVRRMVEEGQSDEDIKAYFVSRYGEWILRAPKKEGLGLVIWMAPGAAILLAGGWIGWRVYRGHRHPASHVEGAQELTPEQRERIARDLRRFEEED